jgi:hypothetical protein
MIKTRKRIGSEPLSIKKFVERNGLKEYQGIRGFDNLMLLLKADIKSLFREHSKIQNKETIRIKTIQEAIEPYRDHWDEWTSSDFCTLTDMELRAVNFYRVHYSHKQMAEQFNLPYNLVYTHFRNALHTLKSRDTRTKFQEWLKSKVGISEQKLLDAPIMGLRSLMSTRLRFTLSRIESTIREILEKHTIQDLLQHRGIGTTSMDELKTILRDHGFLSLLKEK